MTHIQRFAKMLGCTEAQINTQFGKNARQLRAMHAQSVQTGLKVNGFTSVQLDKLASSYERRAVRRIN